MGHDRQERAYELEIWLVECDVDLAVDESVALSRSSFAYFWMAMAEISDADSGPSNKRSVVRSK
jgi:hypothetical protein